MNDQTSKTARRLLFSCLAIGLSACLCLSLALTLLAGLYLFGLV